MHQRSPGEGPLACSKLTLGTVFVVRVIRGIAQRCTIVRPSIH